MDCLLCHSPHAASFKVIKKPERSYFHCDKCDSIFMTPDERLSPEHEKARYDLHHNEETAGYLAFFEPLLKTVDEHFKAAKVDSMNLTSLDYGCGPNPVISNLLAQRGYHTHNYDIYYHPDQDQLRRTYHLVTCTEVWEHFNNPRLEIERILRLLKPGGILAVMTSAHRGEAVFHDWHYRRDPTHVFFFSEESMKWLAQTYKLHVIKAKSPYWVFQKLI